MQGLLEQAAARTSEAQDLRPDTADVDRAKLCLMHYIACALSGSRLPWSRSVIDLVASRSAPGSAGATLLNHRARVFLEDAVFANAVLGQSTLAEDLHPTSLTHPGSMVIPAALAAAEETGVTGRHLLTGLMAGYDVMCGIGSILKTPSFAARGFRPSGVFGPLGAAATAAAIHGLDHQRAVSALAIATGTSAGLREWAHAGTTDVYVQNGFAARNGYTAAQLAAHGITGPKSALDGAAGLGQAMLTEAVDWDAAARQFAQTHAVRDVEFKRFPACSAVQGVLELATRIWTRHRIDPAEISTVTVYTHRHGATNPGCDNAGPFSSIGQAQMSNQLGVSLALHGEKLDVNSFARHDDPSVSALARLVDVREDPELTARYPGTVSAKIVIRGTGRDVTETLDMASSLGNAEIMTFVQDVLDAHFSSRAASEIMDDLQSAEELEDLHHLLALLRGE